MKKLNTRIRTSIAALLLIGSIFVAKGQTVLYEEDFGMPAVNTLIQNYNGWQNTTVTYVGNGTCDVRATSASTGYGCASGGGNVMINDTVKWFQISGLNTTATHPTVKLYCGLRKTSGENGENFVVEFSTDSLVWVRLPLADTIPSGSGTSGWHRVCFPNVPAHPHLHLRFSNLANVDYRLDDIRITDGDEIVLETVETPTATPAGGIYYEPQQVTLECATAGATIRYTLNGSMPDSQSTVCVGVLNISGNCTLKAYAVKEGMYNSNFMSAQYIIIDTDALVTLPFDISHNSDSAKAEVKVMPGFRGNKLGTSYADGSVKFESKNAGAASLTAALDSTPGELSFDMRGVKGGSPSSYSGITILVSESADGQLWTTVTTLNEVDIGTNGYSHFGPYTLSEETRHIRWLLAAATSGNTQLNNIAITLRSETVGEENGHEEDDSEINNDSGMDERSIRAPAPYPNPTHACFRWDLGEEASVIALYDLSGNLIRRWTGVPDGDLLELTGVAAGSYLLQAITSSGRTINKTIVKY